MGAKLFGAGNKDELKIVLYPKKKPRYKFEKESFFKSNAICYSFDINRELAYINSKTPILDGFYKAHSNHYPIRIKPDDIWLLIVQGFSNHVNENSEKLRHMFVNFEDKQTLIVKYPLDDISQVNKKALEEFSSQINEQMKEYLGSEILDTLTPNFTTTTYDSEIVCKISIMGAFKKFFDYEMDLCGCGVPYIILEGTSEDYEKILAKAKNLKKYDFDWYIDRIIPHIQKMIDAKKGNIDYNYFKDFIQNKKETEYVDAASDMGSYKEVDYIKGWILSFFAYYGENKLEPFEDDTIRVKDFDILANQMLDVPFKIVDQVHNKEYMLKYSVGFIGCDQNSKKEVFPVTGWIVSKDEEDIPITF